MKKSLTAVMAAVVIIPAAPAQAASVDVVRAVEKLVAAGAAGRVWQFASAAMPHDPRMDDLPRGSFPSTSFHVHTRGILRLGRSGIVSSDLRREVKANYWHVHFLKEDAANGDRRDADLVKVFTRPQRLRTVGGVQYANGPAYGQKGWVNLGKAPGGAGLHGDQVIDIFEQPTLKALIAKATINRPSGAIVGVDNRAVVKKSWTIRGTITLTELFKLSPAFREMVGGPLHPRMRNLSLMWGISADLSGRPIVVQTVLRTGKEDTDLEIGNVVSATRYGWDAKAAVTAPTAMRVKRVPFGDDITDFFR
ncbi:hypothetical protein OIE67_50935 [Nonomuraea fuscirosea]|uniref:hypothetical protein n=1 Tax=Nonomuraea fuscirosea TaxID=1291556 RepID=UPI002DD83934|nr:hypothetical protein [Nonomuraea fuscirosea]WSA52264.1 hypothetical protein OIE67_50935 [Nonomuraea fuscirosea]